ncbi:hypothetical protein [Anaerotignum propionicum]|uniref:hypothetical protein n=1 Tax=Anaerotignum propionicum TaxID=28446 RepID=UPI00289D4DE2|nr:hypothetical protein [Anaerotignum propionicum]MEA4841933.1 hypothetical protein [[Clostridium] symbiosum]
MHVEGSKVSKSTIGSTDQVFCFLEARMSEAYNMITTARLIQATLSPILAQSNERTHYTTELVKNQDYFKVVFLIDKYRNFNKNYHLSLSKKIIRMVKAHFKLIKNELPDMSNSSA